MTRPAAAATVTRSVETVDIRQNLGLAPLHGETLFLAHKATWPGTRAEVFHALRSMLVSSVPEAGELDNLQRLFTMKQIGSGANGIVYEACLKETEFDPTCKQFVIDGATHSVPLVIKTMMQQRAGDVPALRLPIVHCFSESGRCIADTNSVREALMGNVLNLLVLRGVTPHMPTVYEVFTSRFLDNGKSRTNAKTGVVTYPYKRGERCRVIVTEMCSLTLPDFLQELVENTQKDGAYIKTVMHVVLLQIAHGLASAQQHFNFRHNDFHGKNAMVTFVDHGEYVYKTSTGTVYAIPNFGMCWKPIDFGWSTSDTVFGPHDGGHVLCYSNVARHYDPIGFGFEAREHAVEMYDMVRLMGYMSNAAKLGMYNSEYIDDGGATRRRYAAAHEVFQAGINLSQQLSMRMRHLSARDMFTILDVLPQGMDQRRFTSKQKAVFSESDGVNKSRGLMYMFFEKFAAGFEQPAGSAVEVRSLCKESEGAENCVFADTPVFLPSEDLSGTFMGQHLRVNSAGELITIPRLV